MKSPPASRRDDSCIRTRDLVLVLHLMVREDGQMPQDQTARVLAEHLHVARMSTYMAAAGGDEPHALQLYLWNGRMSAALFETLSVTEVIFRNAIDGALRSWNPSRGTNHTWEWTATPASPLNSMIRRPLQVAHTNATTISSPN